MKKRFVKLAVILSLCSCGSKNNDQRSEDSKKRESTAQKGLNLASQNLTELQTKAPQDVSQLLGVFGISASSDVSAYVAFASDNRYTAGLIQRVSENHYRIHAGVGNYQQNGNQISFQPKRTTCPRPSLARRKITTGMGSPLAESFMLTSESNSVVLTRYHASSNQQSKTGYAIEWGCFLNEFDQIGPFAAHAWTDVPL